MLKGAFQTCLLSAFVGLGLSAGAARVVIRDKAADWTLGTNYEGGVAPAAGDEVVVPGGATVRLTTGSSSFSLVNRLSRIMPGERAVIEITVPSDDDDANLRCPVTDWQGTTLADYGVVAGAGNGTIVKKGAGILNLDVTDKLLDGGSACKTVHAFETSIRVEEGAVKLPQGAPAMHSVLKDIYVAAGAEFWLLSLMDSTLSNSSYGFTTIDALTGLGLVHNASAATRAAGGGRLFQISKSGTFGGLLTGGIVLACRGAGTRIDLTNPNSTYGDNGNDMAIRFTGADETIGLQRLYSVHGAPSSMGDNEFFRVQSAGGARIVYLGTGNETTKMGINVSYSPLTIDAGAHGGITFEGGHEWRGAYGSPYAQSDMQYIYLDGSNTQRVVFRPYLRPWVDAQPSVPAAQRTNSHWHITKKGTGTWYFQQYEYAEWRGGLAVENGTVQFDTLAETNRNCSLGYASHAQRPYQGKWNPAYNTPYHVKLGDGTKTSLGVLEYIGSNFIHSTARKIGIEGRGCIKSSGRDDFHYVYNGKEHDMCFGPRRMQVTGVMGVGAGEHELVLDGANNCSDHAENIVDGGGTMSVTKRGTGSWTIGGELSLSGRVMADEGTLYVHDGQHYSWFKWTVQQTHGKEVDTARRYAYEIAEFALYDEGGNRVNVGMTAPAFDWYVSDKNAKDPEEKRDGNAQTDYTALLPNSAAIGHYDYKYDVTPLDYAIAPSGPVAITIRYRGLKAAFDDVAPTAENTDSLWSPFPKSTLDLTNPSRWLSLFMHVKPGARVASYDWVVWKGGAPWIPTYWTMQASVNGLDWVDVDTQQRVIPQMDTANDLNYWSYTGATGRQAKFEPGQVRTGYPISVGPVAKSPALANACIAAGKNGRLVADGDITVSRLEIDYANAGTIEGFAFAPSGILNVKNLPRESQVDMPGNYVDVKEFENIANWVLYVNGAPSRKRIAISDGKISILSGGVMIIYR